MKKMKALFFNKQNTKKVFFYKNKALWFQKPFKMTCAPLLCKDKQMSCKKNSRNFETMQNTKFKQINQLAKPLFKVKECFNEQIIV